jgi:hypothetical protein
MALYKEVQQSYEKGLQVPDDITILFSDDNFGSLRRLPTAAENRRKGGSGVSNGGRNIWLRLSLSRWPSSIIISSIPGIREVTDG